MSAKHALMPPSAARRWMKCAPSVRLSKNIPDEGSVYAKEGTLAHKLCELYLREKFNAKPIYEELAKVQNDPLYSHEMNVHAHAYADFIEERYNALNSGKCDPLVLIERKVNFRSYVPESFGTADCIIVAEGTMEVIDFKYGKGVRVDAENNPQMMMYALGAFEELDFAYDIKAIRMTIYQPRMDNTSTFTMGASALIHWAKNTLSPAAMRVWDDLIGEKAAPFAPDPDTCRWCRAAPQCKARADAALNGWAKIAHTRELMTDEEIAQALQFIPFIEEWIKDLRDYALKASLSGERTLPGYKLVHGRSLRKVADEPALIAALRGHAFKDEDIFTPPELKSIPALEKLVGKELFAAEFGAYIEKPEGKPTLVQDTDPRPALNSITDIAKNYIDPDNPENKGAAQHE